MSDAPAPANALKAWTDPASWAERLTPEGCPFCPMEPRGAHLELPASWVLIPNEAVLPGYVVVVSKRHVIEPYELARAEQAQFWVDAMRAAAAVASVVEPVKVNYEIHGNTIPHLHLHVFPRFRGDPFERGPIDPEAVKPARRSAAEIEALRAAIAGHPALTVSAGDADMTPPPRYDGYAEWYDANIAPFAEPAGGEMLDLLGPGPGRCLDLACGTGINLHRLTNAEWTVTGVDLSADQLRVARRRAPPSVELLQADATALPFPDSSFDAIACALLHTDVDDFTAVCREATRVLRPGGRIAYVGIHPCFVGPFARNPPGAPPELHPGYRDTSWTKEGFSDGIRRRTGARHVPMAELLNAFIGAGLRLVRVIEAEDEDYPTRIGILATLDGEARMIRG